MRRIREQKTSIGDKICWWILVSAFLYFGVSLLRAWLIGDFPPKAPVETDCLPVILGACSFNFLKGGK